MAEMNDVISKEAAKLDDSDVWIKHLGESSAVAQNLRALECALRCNSCNNFFRAPVTVQPCQHTFCSECIRKKFDSDRSSTKRYADCSLCNARVDIRGPSYSRCLTPNRKMDTLVHTFQLLRKSLLDVLQSQQAAGLLENPMLAAAVRDATAASEAAAKGGDRAASAVREAAAAVREIIVCAGINLPSLPPELRERRSKLACVIYKSKTKRQLMDLCAVTGLSTEGNEGELRNRHEGFITLYNSECDSLRPRSKVELLAFVASEQNARDREARRQKSPELVQPGTPDYAAFCMKIVMQQRKLLGEAPNSAWTCVPTGYAVFDADMEQRYEKLIKEYRERRPRNSPRKPWVDTTDYALIEREERACAHPATATAAAPTSRKIGKISFAAPAVSCCSTTAEALALVHNPYLKRRVSNATTATSQDAPARHSLSSPACVNGSSATTAAPSGSAVDAFHQESLTTATYPPASTFPASMTEYSTGRPTASASWRNTTAFTGALPNPYSTTRQETAAAPFTPLPSMATSIHNHSPTSLLAANAGRDQDDFAAAVRPYESAILARDFNHTPARRAPLLTAMPPPSLSQLLTVEETPSPPTNQSAGMSRQQLEEAASVSTTPTAAVTAKRKSPLSQNQLNVVEKKVKPSVIGPWACGVCTFWNEMFCSSRARCEMCSSPRPDPCLSKSSHQL